MKTYVLFIAVLLSACIANKPTARIEFNAKDVYPEGVAYDDANKVFYVSSVTHGVIGKVTPAGVYSTLLADTTLKSSYGMKVHPDGKRLFVCTGDATYSRHSTPETKKKLAKLISIDLATGKKIIETDLSQLIPGKHFANDLTFDKGGNAFVTDSYANAIYKVTPGGEASIFSHSPLFETKGFGLNGIIYHPSGFLLVASSNKGQIYKVDVNNPENPRVVKVDQFFLGADGVALKSNEEIVLVANGGNDKIFLLESKDNWATAKLKATTLAADVFTYPATIAMKGSEFWILNAKTTELQDSTGVPSSNFAIQKAVLKPLPK